MVTKLQMYIQEMNKAIEDTSQQVVQNLPRVMREADAVRQEAILLRDQMKIVKDDVTKVEKETAQSVQTLVELDTVKSRMQEASKALQEADNWSSLSADVEEVFTSGDITAISSKLVGMQQSLIILTEVPDYKERCQLLENLKDRLEAMLGPQLVAAFNTQSVDAAQVYMRIFSDIQRQPQLQIYYHKCHQSQLLSKWKSIVEADQEESLLDWLTNFYDHLLATWHTQLKWCSQVFLNCSPVHILCKLFVDVIKQLDPSVSFCMEAAMKQQTNSLVYLMDLKQVSDRFARSLESSIQIFNPALLQDESVQSLAEVVYSAYKPYVRRYGRLEEKWLTSAAILAGKEDVSDAVRVIADSITKLISMAKEADSRCCQMFHGCTYPGLRKALVTYFTNFMEEVTSIGNNLSRSTVPELEGWTKFQQSVVLLQATGELVTQLEALDPFIAANCVGCGNRYLYISENKGDRSCFKAFELLLLDLPDRRELESLLAGLEKDRELSILHDVHKKSRALCDHALQISVQAVLSLIHKHLTNLSTWQVWSRETAEGVLTSDLPTFSLSPQEHITQIGQYLMTIPQHIEPFIMQDNPGLESALGNVHSSDKQHNHGDGDDTEQGEQVADVLLDVICRGVMAAYTEAVLKIPRLTPHSSAQLATDIEYLCNVLEDLGIRAPDDLQHLAVLIRATPAEFKDKSEGSPAQLIAVVQDMRRLNTTS